MEQRRLIESAERSCIVCGVRHHYLEKPYCDACWKIAKSVRIILRELSLFLEERPLIVSTHSKTEVAISFDEE